jgi:acetate kinase
MGTRSSDLDIRVVTYIMDKEEIRILQMGTLASKQSGMLRITYPPICAKLGAAIKQKDKRAIWGWIAPLRVKVFGAYAAMGSVDM